MINVAICDIEKNFNKEVFSILSNISKKKILMLLLISLRNLKSFYLNLKILITNII